MELRPATADEHAAIRRLLSDHRLPTDDLDSAAIDFIVAFDSAGLAGVVGVEPHGRTGLLRSLAVRAGERGNGLGQRLAAAAEARAAALGLRELVLLTETAETYFARRGYQRIDRRTAPAEVQASAEFRSLCPASAVCMHKPLDPA